MALLLIDNRNSNIRDILGSLKSNITPVLYDFQEETFESLADKIPIQSYLHLGIIHACPTIHTYCMIHSFGESILQDVEHQDPFLESWTSFHLFIELCISSLDVQTLDLFDEGNSMEWKYLSRVWNIPIRLRNSNEDVYSTYFKKRQPIERPVYSHRTIMRILLNSYRQGNSNLIKR